MYERFYQLRERPFALSPDPEYLYSGAVHRAGLDYLRYGIEGNAGFVVMTGEIGCGKTTLLQAMLRNLDGETTVVRLLSTMLNPLELLEAIALDLGVDTRGLGKPALLRELARILVQQRSVGRRVVLVIDEAQNLSLPSLEEVRMLSNFETEKSKLLQIVLVGQPELRDTLALPQLEQLRQRVSVTYHIARLDADATAEYINYRLRRAALGPPLQFTREVCDLVYGGSGGVPRMINVICDSTLLFGYGEDRRVVDSLLVRSVLHELYSTGVLKRPASAPAEVRPAAAVGGQRTAHAPAKALPQSPPATDIRRSSVPPIRQAPILLRAAPPPVAAATAGRRHNGGPPPAGSVWERFRRLMLDEPGTELDDRR